MGGWGVMCSANKLHAHKLMLGYIGMRQTCESVFCVVSFKDTHGPALDTQIIAALQQSLYSGWRGGGGGVIQLTCIYK